jgi:Nitronate monooxygenase
VNHTLWPFNEEVFATTLEARPLVISFAHGDPGEFVKRAHDAGSVFMHMVNTVQQARQAAERGVDIIIAQDSESAGFSGTVSTLALVPQVVDAVSPVPVIAAGGIADGRGLAAALVLGAQGINTLQLKKEAAFSDYLGDPVILSGGRKSPGRPGYGARPATGPSSSVGVWRRLALYSSAWQIKSMIFSRARMPVFTTRS